MAALARKHGQIAVACGQNVLFCDTCEYRGWKKITLPQTKCDKNEGDDDGQGQTTSNNVGNRVLALAFSRSGQYLAICDDRKQVILYKTGHEWTAVSTRPVVRRGTSIVFTKDETKFLVADKSGDVYTFSVSEPDEAGELTLGHLSMVLDLALTADDCYVVTCDRDEKIRISNFSNAYNIYSFCLGHSEFVSSLCYVEEYDILISGSGDLSLRAWSMEGKQLCCVQTGIPPKMSGTDQSVDNVTRPAVQKLTYCPKHKLLAVAFFGSPKTEIYRLTSQESKTSLTLIQSIEGVVSPWDVLWDQDGYLFILQPLEGSNLRIYTTDVTGDTIQLKEINEDDSLSKPQRDITSHWDLMKACLDIPSVVPTLWKQRIDNMSDYLKRKQQRLAGDKAGGDNSSTDEALAEKMPKQS